MTYSIQHARIEDVMSQTPKEKFHGAFGDPPYFLESISKRYGSRNAAPAKDRDGLYKRASRGFMGQTWDGFKSVYHYQEWVTSWAQPMIDWLHPASLGIFFGGTRTIHRLITGLEDAGWEIVDLMQYIYGSSVPKGHKADDSLPGYRTALKAAYEPIVIARTPRYKMTYKHLIHEFGTGCFNIDACRIPGEYGEGHWHNKREIGGDGIYNGGGYQDVDTGHTGHEDGRYPTNIIFDPAAGQLLDNTTGDDKSCFFYSAKAPTWQRQAGLDSKNPHPTIKPISLTEYLAKLILPPDTVSNRRLLVPFSGVGSEMIGARLAGWDFVQGIEMTEEYIPVARKRLDWWQRFSSYAQADAEHEQRLAEEAAGLKQETMFNV